jgi:molecular chaperone HscB
VANYFSSFDLEPAFTIDLAALEHRYEQLMTICHPDRFSAAPAFEKRAAAKRAADINEAFNVLKQPVSRAGHLLQLSGIDLPALERQPAAPEFLFEQMMLRERVQAYDALTAADAAELTSEIEAAYVSTQAKFIQYYDAGDIAAASAAWVEFHFQQKLSDELARARS